MFFALIGDIVGSRNIAGRAQVQAKLKRTLDAINRDCRDALASNLTITLGDEFQGLFTGGKEVLEAVERIDFALSPVSVRFGIGYGEITTAIDRDIALGADGPAYYRARRMVEEMKSLKTRQRRLDTDIKFASQDSDSLADDTLNGIFLMLTFLERRWTARQREIVQTMKESGNSQVNAAKKLGIQQSSVQKSLNHSGYYLYYHLRNLSAQIIEQNWR